MRRLSPLLLSTSVLGLLAGAGCGAGTKPGAAPPGRASAGETSERGYARAYGEVAARVGAAQRRFAAGKRPSVGGEAAILRAQGENARVYGEAVGDAAVALGRLKPPARLAAAHRASLDVLLALTEFQGRNVRAFVTGDRTGFERGAAAFRREIPAKLAALRAARAGTGLPPLLEGG